MLHYNFTRMLLAARIEVPIWLWIILVVIGLLGVIKKIMDN